MKANENIIDLVCDLKRKCIDNDAQFISDLNITESEYNFIKALINCRNFNSKAIAQKMNLSASRVSRIIDNMVKKGFITRTYSKGDRRNINIKLTENGMHLKAKVIKFRKVCENKIIKSLSESEQISVKIVLNKIINLLS